VDDPLVAEVVVGIPGRIRALAEGTARVTATAVSGASGWADLLVAPPVPVFIEISPLDATGVAGAESIFTATAFFSDGTQRDVTGEAIWDAMGMGIIAAPGVIVPTMSGDIPVTASLMAEFGAAFGAAFLHVPPFAVEILVEPQNLTAYEGDVISFTATARMDTGSYVDVTATATWIADRVDAVATGLPGQFRFDGTRNFAITAVNPSATLSGVSNVWIEPSLVSVSLVPQSAAIDVGSGTQFLAEAHMSDGTTRGVTPDAAWSAVDTGVAWSAGGGYFSAGVVGTTEVVASWTWGSTTAEGRGTLTVNPIVTGFLVTQPPAPYLFGEPIQFGAQLEWSDGTFTDVTGTATWSVERVGAVAMGPGQFRFQDVGGFWVRADAPGGFLTKFVYVDIVAAPTLLTLSPTGASIAQGSYVAFNAFAEFTDGSTVDVTPMVTWSILNTAVVGQAPGNQFEALAPGTTDVVATYAVWGVKVTGSATVTVW
jgi:hypothetical protein